MIYCSLQDDLKRNEKISCHCDDAYSSDYGISDHVQSRDFAGFSQVYHNRYESDYNLLIGLIVGNNLSVGLDRLTISLTLPLSFFYCSK